MQATPGDRKRDARNKRRRTARAAATDAKAAAKASKAAQDAEDAKAAKAAFAKADAEGGWQTLQPHRNHQSKTSAPPSTMPQTTTTTTTANKGRSTSQAGRPLKFLPIGSTSSSAKPILKPISTDEKTKMTTMTWAPLPNTTTPTTVVGSAASTDPEDWPALGAA